MGVAKYLSVTQIMDIPSVMTPLSYPNRNDLLRRISKVIHGQPSLKQKHSPRRREKREQDIVEGTHDLLFCCKSSKDVFDECKIPSLLVSDRLRQLAKKAPNA